MTTENGTPELADTMPPSCQLPRSADATPDVGPGSSQSAFATKTCRRSNAQGPVRWVMSKKIGVMMPF